VTFESEGGGLLAGKSSNFFVAIELNEGAEVLEFKNGEEFPLA